MILSRLTSAATILNDSLVVSPRQTALELFVARVIFPSCRFTNSIAKNASATAKSSCAPAIGREPPARTAVQRNCPRNFPSLLLPAPAAAMTRRCVPAAAAVVAADIVTDIKFVWVGRRVADPKFRFRDGDTPSLPQPPAPECRDDFPLRHDPLENVKRTSARPH